jgi:hypothetical protein
MLISQIWYMFPLVQGRHESDKVLQPCNLSETGSSTTGPSEMFPGHCRRILVADLRRTADVNDSVLNQAFCYTFFSSEISQKIYIDL